jgi:hypothetical protein
MGQGRVVGTAHTDKAALQLSVSLHRVMLSVLHRTDGSNQLSAQGQPNSSVYNMHTQVALALLKASLIN